MPLSIPHPVDKNRRYDFRNAYPNENDPELSVSNFSRLHETRMTDVFRGQLSEPCNGSTDIVCKLAYGLNNVKKLEREAGLYRGKLKALQKTVVPTCHGYFVGHTDDGIIGCLVLDYCGEPVDLVFSALNRDFRCVSILEAVSYSQCICRLDLVDGMTQIHEAGISHNDFGEHNVLDHSGVPIIIDFEDAIEEVCQCKMEIIENALSPHPADFDCKELFDVCQSLRVWKPCASLTYTCSPDLQLTHSQRLYVMAVNWSMSTSSKTCMNSSRWHLRTGRDSVPTVRHIKLSRIIRRNITLNNTKQSWQREVGDDFSYRPVVI